MQLSNCSGVRKNMCRLISINPTVCNVHVPIRGHAHVTSNNNTNHPGTASPLDQSSLTTKAGKQKSLQNNEYSLTLALICQSEDLLILIPGRSSINQKDIINQHVTQAKQRKETVLSNNNNNLCVLQTVIHYPNDGKTWEVDSACTKQERVLVNTSNMIRALCILIYRLITVKYMELSL